MLVSAVFSQLWLINSISLKVFRDQVVYLIWRSVTVISVTERDITYAYMVYEYADPDIFMNEVSQIMRVGRYS